MSATFFVLAPLAGRVNVSEISGSLLGNEGVKAEFAWRVASGNITLYAKKNNDKHDVYANFDLEVSLYGHIKDDDFFLVALA